MLERAIAILARNMKASDSTAMLQLKNANSLTEALTVMVQASMFSSNDASRLSAFVQTSQQDSDSDDEPGAPAAAVYEAHTGGIVETLNGLLEKAENQLDKARKTETTNLHNYQMMRQSLEDEIKFGNNDMDAAKKGLSESQEKKANAEGDHKVTSADLEEDLKTKATLHSDCMNGAEEFELATKSRGEELKALATAKKVIKETTGGAAEQTYGFNQLSFMQLSSSADLAKAEAIRFVRDLARKDRSPALAQLASRMTSAVKLANGDDPFAKVEGLIRDMVATLEAEAEADATHKAYCDKEIGENTAKKDDLFAESNKLSTKIAQQTSQSNKLRSEVAALQKELAEMAKARAEADKMRAEENAAYKKNSAEMELGVEGVKKALDVLRDYYAKDGKSHVAAEGAGAGIIGLLEVCESDFTKGLTEMTAQEESAQADYEAYCKEDDISRASKTKDVQYKTQEAAGLDKNIAELSTDLEGVTDELNAVLEVLEKLDAQCSEKAETYEEKKARRDSEIAGLKQALAILNGEAVLLQKASKHTLRGVQHHQ
jgi:chromosome segregation ATPase